MKKNLSKILILSEYDNSLRGLSKFMVGLWQNISKILPRNTLISYIELAQELARSNKNETLTSY